MEPLSEEDSPWWNDQCQAAVIKKQEAVIYLEKNPSSVAAQAYQRQRAALNKTITYAKRLWASKMAFTKLAATQPVKYAHLPDQVKSKSVQETRKSEKKKKKKKMKDDGTDSEGDNLDLTQDLYPLAHYISDQEELINQIFSTIRGSKLEAMLPPVLKSIPMQELKKLCLHELRGMSKKRIVFAINGEAMSGSSDSEEEEEEEDETPTIVDDQQKKKKNNTPEKRNGTHTDRNKENSSNQGLPAYLMKTIKIEDPDGTSGGKSSPGGKSVMELLELQMRARIIKTMLETQKGDDGKTLTEDAIAALMGTTTQTAAADASVSQVVKVEKDLNSSHAKSKSDSRQEHSKAETSKDIERGKENIDGKRHRDDSGRRSRSGHKKDHHRKSSDGKRGSKRPRSTEVRESDDEDEKKSRRNRSSDKRSRKKKKITRKEFQERMKRAKKNRTYRQRKSSEDEAKANALKQSENSKGEEINSEGKAKEENKEKSIIKNKEDGGEAASEKEESEAVLEKDEGEAVSEKEEGEWDSNEEEEGACSPSDISSQSYYSSSYSSRSRSRSYSKSRSRSPTRRGGGGGHSRGRSRSKSWTRSRSRSRSNEKRKRAGDGGGGRWAKKRTRERGGGGSGNKKMMSSGIVSLPSSGNQKQQKENQKQQKDEEDNWGQSCDIEFVDSEEDFDDNTTTTNAAKKTTTVVSSKKPLPTKGQNSAERASISFSLQKKVVPSITQNVDLDDLPLKTSALSIIKERNIAKDVIIKERNITKDVKAIASKMQADKPKVIIDLDSPKASPKRISEQILISSDSENEVKNIVKAKSVRVEKRELGCSVKDSECSISKTKPAYSKASDNVIISSDSLEIDSRNQATTSQESDLKTLDDEITDDLNNEKKKEQFDKDEASSSEQQNQNDAVSGKCNVDEEGEKENEQNETSDVNEKVQSEPVEETYQKMVETDETCDLEKGSNSQDSEFIDVETVDSIDENIDIPQRIEVSSETGREDGGETAAAATDIATKSLNESEAATEAVQINNTQNQDQFLDSSSLEKTQRNQMDVEDISCPVKSDGHPKEEEVEKDIKESVVSKRKTRSRKTQEPKISIEKRTTRATRSSKKVKSQKVELEHLQETYNEDQESQLERPFEDKQETLVQKSHVEEQKTNLQKAHEEEQGTRVQKSHVEEQKITVEEQKSHIEEQETLVQKPHEEVEESTADSERHLQDDTMGLSGEFSPEEKESCKETTIEINNEVPKETHDEGECEESNQLTIEEKEENKVEEKEGNKEVLKPDEAQHDIKEKDNFKNREPTDDFYRGADQLAFSDDETGNCNKDEVEDVSHHVREVEPIRIETGLIRRRVTRSKKVEMAAPEKSWTKKEKKKREMGGIGLLKTTLAAESSQSPATSKEDDEEPLKLQDSSEGKETSDQGNDDDTSTSWGISSISSRDEMSVESRVHSPKEITSQNVEMSLKGGNSEISEIQDDSTSQKKTGQETEIIGVIETNTNPNADQMEGIDLGGSSWSMRWLQSEKVQKVVSNSKMLSRVRKKIQKKEKATKVVTAAEKPVLPQKKIPEPVMPIIGSIEEYERLFGMKAKKPLEETASKSEEPTPASAESAEVLEHAVTQDAEQPPKKPATFGSDDEGEDSEEEALWSQICGK